MIQKLIITFLSSFLGTFGFAALLHAPKRSWFGAALLGAISYTIYEYMILRGWSNTTASFVGTLVGSLLAQIFARRMRMIATIFVALSIIPCVPGLGLYRCMSELAQGHSAEGAQIGVSAMACIVMMALAIGLSSFIFRIIHPVSKR